MDSQLAPEPTDIRRYIEPIVSRWWMILAVAAIATAATYFYYDSKPKEYTASSAVYVRTSPLDRQVFGDNTADPDRNTSDQAKLLRSRTVAERVAKRLDFRGDPVALLSAIKVNTSTGSDFVSIKGTQPSPKAAARLVNVFASEFIAARREASRREIRASRQISEAELSQTAKTPANAETRKTLAARIRRLRVLEALPTGSAEQVDRALAPGKPSAPKPRRNALFALFVSLVFAIGAAFGLGRIDRRLRRVDEIESLYDLPLLATVAHTKSIAPDTDGRAVLPSDLREAFRTLRTNVELLSLDRALGLDRGARTILVTSAEPREGKSSVVRNLALAYREAGAHVAVIEADLRQPTLKQIFQIDPTSGLTNVLTGERDLATALEPVTAGATSPATAPLRTSVYGGSGTPAVNGSAKTGELVVLTSGGPAANPPAVLASNRVRELLAEIAADHDVVLIDSPPILAVSDAIPLLTAVDATIVVARLDQSTRDAARRLMELIRRVPGSEVLGVVANDAREDRARYRPYS